MRYDIARGCMELIHQGATPASLAALGVTEEDYRLTTGDAIWLIQDHRRAKKTLDALIYGCMEISGVPKFEVPAEFVAAVCATFVKPPNLVVVCRVMEQSFSEAEVIARDGYGTERLRPEHLLALILELKSSSNDDVQRVITAFERKTGWNQKKASIERATGQKVKDVVYA